MLGLAQESPLAFKDATLSMPALERAKLEKAIRESVIGQGQGKGNAGGAAHNTAPRGIELKSFG